MFEYQKIETLFNRETTGKKKLIEGEFRNKTVELLKDFPWLFTEKIDGTNIRVHWDGHKVEFAGRTDKASIPQPLLNRLNELFAGSVNEELFEQLFGDKDVILFGEGYGNKIQKVGKLYRNDVDFILFDVMVDGLYLIRGSVDDIAKTFNVDTVPIIMIGTLQEGIDYVKKAPQSKINTNAPMEGVVGKPLGDLCDRLGNRIVVKIKVCDHCDN